MASLSCSPPVLEVEEIICAKPLLIVVAPTPTDPPATWLLHVKLQSYADAGGAILIDEVDSSINPELFEYECHNLDWLPFPELGLTPENYGRRVRATLEIGPRTQVWVKASVGANDV